MNWGSRNLAGITQGLFFLEFKTERKQKSNNEQTKRVDLFSKGFYSHTNFYLLISFPLIGEISYCILATLRTNGTDPLY